MGCQKISPAPGQFLDAEQIKLLAQHAMVALRRLFQPRKVRVHILLREERRAINALQLRILLVAEPVRAGKARHLHRLHAPR